MSGLEVAGAVLGAIPLLVEALKLYCDGVSTVKAIAKYRSQFCDSYLDFNLHLTELRKHCETYLSGLMLPDGKFRELVESQMGWTDPEVEKVLQGKLGPDYDIFVQLFGRLQKRIAYLGGKLGLQEDFSLPFVVSTDSGKKIDEALCAKFFSVWRCLKGGLRNGKYQELMAKIEKDIVHLQRLTKGSTEVESRRSDRKKNRKSRVANNLAETRAHACSFYEALQKVWTQRCSAPHTHNAKFLLELPRDTDNDTPCFHFSFTLEARTQSIVTLPWDEREIKVLALGDPSTLSQPTCNVQFVLPEPESNASDPASRSCICTEASEIDDLCTALTCHCNEDACLGSLTHQQFRYHIHGGGNKGVPRGALDLLSNIFFRPKRRGLAPTERSKIAFSLAAAVLQLYETPWLRDDWSLQDLYFSQNSTTCEVYIAETFDSETNRLQRSDSQGRQILAVKNRTLFALGVALLELAYGQPLSQCTQEKDLNSDGKEDDLAELNEVFRLHEQFNKEEPSDVFKFTRAVNWCFYPVLGSERAPKGRESYSLSNPHLRDRFYEDVVVPLQEDYDLLCRPRQ